MAQVRIAPAALILGEASWPANHDSG